MPYTVPVSFDRFIENISLKGKHWETAIARRDLIVQRLISGFDVVDAFPTGSLVRETALRQRADMDIMVVLHYRKHIEGKAPNDVLQAVRDHLGNSAGLVKKNGQAVTIHYTAWPKVDIVPVYFVGSDAKNPIYYKFPDKNKGQWCDTDPRKHDLLVRQQSDRGRQLIQVIKTWNLAHSDYLRSFHIETMVLNFQAHGGSWPWEVYRFFDLALTSIDYQMYHPDSINGRVDDYLSYADRVQIKIRLGVAKKQAMMAWYYYEIGGASHQKSVDIYRTLFGDQFPAYG